MSRCSVVQPSLFGGFSVVDVKLKVQSFVVQWIKRFASPHAYWTSFMDFRFCFRLNLPPLEVLPDPYGVVVRDLPLFYQSLVLAWRAVDGSYSAARSSLVMASGLVFATASDMSAKFCYVYLLSECYSPLYCVLNFSHRFGDLYWSTTWSQVWTVLSSISVGNYAWCFVYCCSVVFFWS